MVFRTRNGCVANVSRDMAYTSFCAKKQIRLMFHYQKWQSGPTPNPFQTDPLLYGTYYQSSFSPFRFNFLNYHCSFELLRSWATASTVDFEAEHFGKKPNNYGDPWKPVILGGNRRNTENFGVAQFFWIRDSSDNIRGQLECLGM